MPVIKTLPKVEKEEIKDHKNNTSNLYVKTYSLRQLSFMDGIDTRTIKTSGKYLPVRVDTGESLCRFNSGITKKPYMIRYIRLDEVKNIFNIRTKKKLTID